MAKKKSRGKRRVTRRARGAGEVLRETWSEALDALASGEAEMQKQIKGLLRRNKIGSSEAAKTLRQLGTRLERGRRKALKGLDMRLAALQVRAARERKALSKFVDHSVKGTLAAFNIPSRHEVAELTRKVDELSRKIDTFKRRR